VTEIVRISVESSRDDIRSLAKKILKTNPYFSSWTRGERKDMYI